MNIERDVVRAGTAIQEVSAQTAFEHVIVAPSGVEAIVPSLTGKGGVIAVGAHGQCVVTGPSVENVKLTLVAIDFAQGRGP
jgi:hypothetical protein